MNYRLIWMSVGGIFLLTLSAQAMSGGTQPSEKGAKKPGGETAEPRDPEADYKAEFKPSVLRELNEEAKANDAAKNPPKKEDRVNPTSPSRTELSRHGRAGMR